MINYSLPYGLSTQFNLNISNEPSATEKNSGRIPSIYTNEVMDNYKPIIVLMNIYLE